jgi:hypothetical protein
MQPPMSRISCDRLLRVGGVHQLIRTVVHLFPARGQIIFLPVSPMAALSSSKSPPNDRSTAGQQCLGHLDVFLEELDHATNVRVIDELAFFRNINRYTRHIPEVVTGASSRINSGTHPVCVLPQPVE